MSINLYYDNATFVQATGVPRQWTITYDIEIDGNRQTITRTFPDDLQAAVNLGFITTEELKEMLFEMADRVERRRLGVY